MNDEAVISRFGVSREMIASCKLYEEILRKWQSTINLVSPLTLADVWKRHILDSLQLIPYIPNHALRVADIGSGAGLPGLLLAICGYQEVHLIESDIRKTIFIREAARLTKARVIIHGERAETCVPLSADVIVSRACSALENLLALARPHLKENAFCLFHKGKNYSTELEAAKKEWLFECQVIPSVIDHQSVLLRLWNVRKRL